MKLNLVLREYLSLAKSDMVFIVGKDLCSEAYLYDRDKMYYMEDPDLAIPIFLGIVRGTESKVHLIITDSDLQNNLSGFVQAGLTKSSNLFIVILRTKTGLKYNPNPIITNLRSYMGFIDNIGFVAINYSPYFTKVSNTVKLKDHFLNMKGPSAAIIDVDSYKLSENNIDSNVYNRMFNING